MSSGSKHHYVPKFLLKQFSQDRKLIDVFRIKPRRLHKNVGLAGQCYEHFYYGRDNTMEDAFSKIESEAALTIRAICEVRLNSITADQMSLLRQFVIYQGSRTRAAAEESSRFMEATSKEIIRKKVEIEGLPDGIPENFLEMVEFKFQNSQYLSLSAAAHSMPAVYDLEVKILVSKENHEFILSDNPVIRCNQFAEFHPYFSKIEMGTRGLAQKGIQIFMPISPLVCLALYDPTTYQFGSPKKPFVIIGDNDLRLLNRLQAVGADTCLYQSPTGPGIKELSAYADFRDDWLKSRKPRVRRSQERLRPGGQMSQMIITSTENFKIGRKFSFAQVIDKRNYDGSPFLPARSRELVENIQLHRAELDRREEALKLGNGIIKSVE